MAEEVGKTESGKAGLMRLRRLVRTPLTPARYVFSSTRLRISPPIFLNALQMLQITLVLITLELYRVYPSGTTRVFQTAARALQWLAILSFGNCRAVPGQAPTVGMLIT